MEGDVVEEGEDRGAVGVVAFEPASFGLGLRTARRREGAEEQREEQRGSLYNVVLLSQNAQF